jgi:Zn-dependent protease
LPNLDITQLFIGFLVLIVSLSVHEAAHAWSADRLGDATARMLGRLSLNPAVHVDPIGTILFPLISMVTGAPLIGWAKPVPVNARALGHHWRQKFMIVAAAGPISNLCMAAICAVALRLFVPSDAAVTTLGSTVSLLFYQMVRLNVVLALFNMIPVPPLDGGNVLAGLLTGPAANVFDRLRPYGFMILYGLMLTGVLFTIISPAEVLLLRWLL